MAKHTYPDAVQPVHLARFSTCHRIKYFLVAVRVTEFYCTMTYEKLTSKGGRDSKLPEYRVKSTLYSYFDWAIGLDDRLSYSANVECMLGDLVGRYPHKHPVDTTHYNENKHVVVSDAGKDGLSMYYCM